MPSKKVAIIGAGPSGLVTAKTLLHNFPQGTFSPVIFDSRHELGGLWSSPQSDNKRWGADDSSGSLDPSMRTNLSRFSVAFSDLSWESVLGTPNVPMFPQARQVCQYLKTYQKRYIPDDMMKLGCRVLKTIRKTKDKLPAQWEVSWMKERSEQVTPGICSRENIPEVEEFDLLVVASGYFARPHIPEIPGLHHASGGVFHSSEIQSTHEMLRDEESILARGDVAVIGGSISGTEAASTVALHQSSYISKGKISESYGSPKVYHIYTRPFWSLPTYLPHETSNDTIAFMPLDLVMYDLGRRPAGPVQYALGLMPEEKVTKTNEYFGSLLGANYTEVGHLCEQTVNQNTHCQPPWVSIGNDYAEFVRSGRINSTMGRAVSVHPGPGKGLSTITVETNDGKPKTLEGIAAVVVATGFTPFETLSILPQDVLSILEYSTDHPFLPLVLDKGGTIRSELPDIGFVGFYRGPYWGAMEMQARFLGSEWAGQATELSLQQEQVETLRIMRDPTSNSRRSQFPMGDYVGLMEMFSRDLGIVRTAFSNDQSQTGPVVPSRYPYNEICSIQQKDMERETRSTLEALKALFDDFSPQSSAAAMAVFRALQGKWKYQRTGQATGGNVATGVVDFIPRYPSDAGYDKEYVCEEYFESNSTDNATSLRPTTREAFRLSESMSSGVASQIQVSTEQTMGDSDILKPAKSLLLTALERKKREDDGEVIQGQYVIHARTSSANVPGYQDTFLDDSKIPYEYTFNFEGVSIVSWEKLDPEYVETKGEGADHRASIPCTRTIYRR